MSDKSKNKRRTEEAKAAFEVTFLKILLLLMKIFGKEEDVSSETGADIELNE